MKSYLCYELANYPMSLFDENGMRKETKSVFYDNFDTVKAPNTNENLSYVVDGGYILHRVIWKQNSTVKEIIKIYLEYLQKNYDKAVIV